MAHIDITSEEQFTKEVLQAALPVLVDYWAEWCGPCHMIEPTLAELETEYEGKVIFARIDVDALPELSSKYSVQSIPTIALMVHGEEKERVIGAHPKDDYISLIKLSL